MERREGGIEEEQVGELGGSKGEAGGSWRGVWGEDITVRGRKRQTERVEVTGAGLGFEERRV